MNFYGNFFDLKNSLNQFIGQTISKIRDLIFYRFYSRFSISHFLKFSKKKKGIQKCLGGIFLASKNYSDKSRGHNFLKI